MHTPLIDTPTGQRLDIPTGLGEAGYRTPPEDVIPDLAFILGLVYLEAGLPPEAALRSALADYVCSFSGMEMEAL
jgi:hypothetical protein